LRADAEPELGGHFDGPDTVVEVGVDVLLDLMDDEAVWVAL
jgi:hypothetical protein